MKHTFLFAVLLAVILSLGYYSVNLADLFSDDTDDDALPDIARSGTAPSVIHITADPGFSPMSMIEPSNSSISPALIRNDINICTAMVKVMSRYDDKNLIYKTAGKELIDSWQFSRNGYIYTEGFKYLNTSGEQRFLACIISERTYRIVYIRFYDNDSPDLSQEQINNALDYMDSASMKFYSILCPALEKVFDSEVFVTEEQITPAKNYDMLYNAFLSFFNRFKGAFIYNSPYNEMSSTEILPFSEFWLPSLGMTCVGASSGEDQLNPYDYYNDIYPESTGYIIDSLMYREIVSTVYSVYKGCIYQDLNIESNHLITIYNIEDGIIEGFYAQPN